MRQYQATKGGLREKKRNCRIFRSQKSLETAQSYNLRLSRPSEEDFELETSTLLHS